MPTYITEAELEAYAGTTVGTPEADFAIDQAEAIVRNFLDQQITAVANDVVYLDGTGHDQLRLPQRPVTAVDEVKDLDVVEAGAVYPADGWFLRGSILFYRNGRWPYGRGNIKVTYDHGWSSVPADIKTATLNVARRVLDEYGAAASSSVSQETIGSYSYTVSTTGGADTSASIGLSSLEEAILRKYKVSGPASGSRL